MMLMPNTVRNLSQYMKEGDSLEIEHLPFISCFDFKIYHSSAITFRKYNPFHGILSPFFMENMDARNHVGVDGKVAYWRSVKERKVSFFPWDEETSGGLIHEATCSHHLILQAIQNIETLLPIDQKFQARLNIENNLYKANPRNFFSNVFIGSLSELIAMEFTVLNQQDSIKAFLERNGFKEVKVERRDNSYNGRKNVWMISAIRNAEPISKDDL